MTSGLGGQDFVELPLELDDRHGVVGGDQAGDLGGQRSATFGVHHGGVAVGVLPGTQVLQGEAQVIGLAPVGLAAGSLEPAQEAADTLADVAVRGAIFGGGVQVHDG